MSKFLESVLDKQTTPQAVTPEPVPAVPVTPVAETPSPDPLIIETPAVVPEPAPIVPIVETPTIVPEKKKVQVDVKEYLTGNKETVLKLLQETDYSAVRPEEAIRIKLLKENPEWDAEDVAAELETKYGVGLKVKEIDTTTMTDDEITEAEAHNKHLASLKRSLKKDGNVAKTELTEELQSLELPLFEHEIDVEAPVVLDKSAAIADYLKEGQDALKKTVEEVWVPALSDAFKGVEKVTEKVVFKDDEGTEQTLDVDITLTPEDKEKIVSTLAYYTATEEDNKYMDAEGNVDYVKFLTDKSPAVLREKINAEIARQSAEKAVQDYIRTKVVNYSSGVRNNATHEQTEGDPARGIWKSSKNRA